MLRNKVPKLRISENSIDALYVQITLRIGTIGSQKTHYHGAVGLKIFRAANIIAANRIEPVTVWDTGGILAGPLGNARSAVNTALDRQITQFAADWLLVNA